MNCLISSFRYAVCHCALLLAYLCLAAFAQAENVNVLFLGDRGHHEPRLRFLMLEPAMSAAGIDVTYTEDVQDLHSDRLGQFDALILYANIDSIAPAEEKALLDYVAGGGGFVPIHCATYCFRNSEKIVALMGGQFKSHGTGVFRTEIANADHPIMRGFEGFESWDETYVHHLHNEKNRTVLSYRVDEKRREPWTWVRTHGKGRVFYTAWGHDYRTWRNPGFHNLIERGIRWAIGHDLDSVASYTRDPAFPVPKMTEQRTDVQPFEYVDVGGKIPNYTPGEKWGTQGEPISRMQKPLPAEESLKHFVVPEGFRVELFASEPDIGGKPICMAWDERGRLWIAETYDYPNELQPPGKGRDRIRILEDTSGDGRADKFTVFADRLSIPTSIAFYRGGVIVQDGMQTKYLKDTDGDDVADERSTLLSGWAMNDTHGGVGNFQYGLDNWIWGMQGYNDSSPTPSNDSEAESSPSQRFRQGFFRFRPDGSQVEFLRSTNNNTWGLGLSEEGIVFGSTANGYPSVYMPIPNRYYERVRGWTPSLVLDGIADSFRFNPITPNVRQVDWHGGYTAGAGHALYTARAYPKAYWNRTAFVNGPTGHLVGTFILTEDGSDFRSTSPFNLLASDDQWTAPIMAEVGPDGNVWVIDWYNYIVQHNPTPNGFERGKGNAYATDLRDKKHGRIYRVVYGDQPHQPWISLANATPTRLVETLTHPTMLWRKHAQRLLVERESSDVSDQLITLIQDKTVDEIGLNVGATHAIWTLHGLGQFDGSNTKAISALHAALDHPARGVRRNAIQALPPTAESTKMLLERNLLADRDAQVRLAAVLALSDLPVINGTGAALVAMWNAQARYQDRWLSDAFVSAAAINDTSFLEQVANEEPSPELSKVVGIVAEHFARGGQFDDLPAVIASLQDAHPAIVQAAIQGLEKGWPADTPVQLDRELESTMLSMLERLQSSDRIPLIKLANRWGSNKFKEFADKLSEELLATFDDTTLSNKKRLAALDELVALLPSDEDVVEDILDRNTPQLTSDLGSGILRSLIASESAAVGPAIVDRIDGFTPDVRAAAIAVLLRRPQSTAALLDAMGEGALRVSELSLDQKRSLSSHPDASLREQAKELLERGGALPNADRAKVLAEYAAATTMPGNVTSGKSAFTKHCAVCHILNGEGAKVGPNLTGMAAHPKSELLTHILDPNRDVEGNYRRYTVVKNDGRVITGMLASGSKTAIEVIDAEGKKQVVLRDDIDELEGSRLSLMPEGFEQQFTKEQMADLLAYLTDRGQFLQVDMAEFGTVSSDRPMFIGTGDEEKLIFKEWGTHEFNGIPFNVSDPTNGRVTNAIQLYGPNGAVSRKMPRKVEIPCGSPVKAIHLLGGVSGWGFPCYTDHSVSMVVRIQYANGDAEEHELQNGKHFADYIRRIDVPQSEFAFALRDQQLRYLALYPKQSENVSSIELIKGPDKSAPVTMAITLELDGSEKH